MKTSITFMLAIAAAALLLSGCGQQRILLKRHYNKGYYLGSRSLQPAVSTQQREPNRKVMKVAGGPEVLQIPATNEELAKATGRP